MALSSCHFHDSMLLELQRVVQCLSNDVMTINNQIDSCLPVIPPPPGIFTPSFHSTPASSTPDLTNHQLIDDSQPVTTTLQMKIINNSITQLQSLLTFVRNKLTQLNSQTIRPYFKPCHQPSSISTTKNLATSFSHDALISCSCTCPAMVTRSMYWFCSSVCGRLTQIQQQSNQLREGFTAAVTNEEINVLAQLTMMQKSKTVIDAACDSVSSLKSKGLIICNNLQVIERSSPNQSDNSSVHFSDIEGQLDFSTKSDSSKDMMIENQQTSSSKTYQTQKPKKSFKKSASAFFKKILPKTNTNVVSPAILPVTTSAQLPNTKCLDAALSIISNQQHSSTMSGQSANHVSHIYQIDSNTSQRTDASTASHTSYQLQNCHTSQQKDDSASHTSYQLQNCHTSQQKDAPASHTSYQLQSCHTSQQKDDSANHTSYQLNSQIIQLSDVFTAIENSSRISEDIVSSTTTPSKNYIPCNFDDTSKPAVDNTDFQIVKIVCPNVPTHDNKPATDQDETENPVIMAFRLPYYTGAEDFVSSSLPMSPTPSQSVQALINNIEKSKPTSHSISQTHQTTRKPPTSPVTSPTRYLNLEPLQTLVSNEISPVASKSTSTHPNMYTNLQSQLPDEVSTEPLETSDNVLCSEPPLSSPNTVESLLNTSILDESDFMELQDILQSSFVSMTSLPYDERSDKQNENELLTVLNHTMNMPMKVGALSEDLLDIHQQDLPDDIFSMSTVLYHTSSSSISDYLRTCDENGVDHDHTSLTVVHDKQISVDQAETIQTSCAVVQFTVNQTLPSSSANTLTNISDHQSDNLDNAVDHPGKNTISTYQTRHAVRKRLFKAISTQESLDDMKPLSDLPSASKYTKTCHGCELSSNPADKITSFARYISTEFSQRRITNTYPAKNSLQNIQRFMRLQPANLSGTVRDSRLKDLLQRAEDIQDEHCCQFDPVTKKINVNFDLFINQRSPHLFAKCLVFEIFNVSELSEFMQTTSLDSLDQDVINAIKTATYEKFSVTDAVWNKQCVPKIKKSVKEFFKRLTLPVFQRMLLNQLA